MGDSDEDHDSRGGRRGRDKFRRERSDFTGERQGRREAWGGRRPPTDGGRELGGQTGQWDRRKRDYGDNNRRGGGDRPGPGPRGDSPPMKRRRRDWEGGGGGFGGDFGGGPFGGGGGGGQWGGPDMGMGHERRPGGGGMPGPGPGMGAPPPPGMVGGHVSGPPGDEEESVYQQPMKTFKQWLAASTDDVGEEVAVESFNTYKLDYKRTAINKFFDVHKDEEWLREKYHPVVKSKRDCVVRQQLRCRVNAFVSLLQSGRLDKVSLDAEHTDGIVKLLDSAMILMEGGDENDLRILDREPSPKRERTKSRSSRSPERKKAAKKADGQTVKKEATADPPSPSSVPLPAGPPPARKSALDATTQEAAEKAAKEKQHEEFLKKQEAFQQQQKEDLAQKTAQLAAEQAKAQKEKRKHRRRHRDAYSSYETDESESEEDSEDDAADEPAPPGVEPAPPGMEATPNQQEEESVAPVSSEEPLAPGVEQAESPPPPPGTESEVPMDEAKQSAAAAELDGDAEPMSEGTEGANGDSEAAATGGKEQSGDEGVCDMEDGEDDAPAVDTTREDPALPKDVNLPEPRPLHQTRSLHIRNLPPSVTRHELVEIGKKTHGFLRAAVGEPIPEKRFQRRAWLTYEKNVNINAAHWSINTMKLKDHELNVITNQDVVNRVRNVSHLSLSRHAIAADIQLARSLIQHLDAKHSLYEPEREAEAPSSDETKAEGEEADGESVPEVKTPVVTLLVTSNPLLSDALSLTEGDSHLEGGAQAGSGNSGAGAVAGASGHASDGEASASDTEEGAGRDQKQAANVSASGNMFNQDETQVKVLSRLLLYLRLVHSVDYYQASDLSDEHDMPHMCSTIHVRGPVSATFKASLKDVMEYIKTHEQRISVFMKTRGAVSADEAMQLGQKSVDEAVEKFVVANCKEVGKDKYMCPLSGKKFRGPEFVRKHIFNKHADDVQAVRDDVEFFNFFLRDPDRPHIPVASSGPLPVRARLGPARGHGPMAGPGPHPPMQGGPNPGFDYPPEGMYGGGPPGFMGGWGPRPHMMGYNPPFHPGMFPFGPPMDMFGGRPPFPPGGPRGRGRRDRRLMDYRDLDQPEDVDF